MNGWTDARRSLWLGWIDVVVDGARAAGAPSVIMVVLLALAAAVAGGYEDTLAENCHMVGEVMHHRFKLVDSFEAMVEENVNWRWN